MGCQDKSGPGKIHEVILVTLGLRKFNDLGHFKPDLRMLIFNRRRSFIFSIGFNFQIETA